jgi:hypothetical protein
MIEVGTQHILLAIVGIVAVCVVIAAKSDKMYAGAMAVIGLLGWMVFRYVLRENM